MNRSGVRRRLAALTGLVLGAGALPVLAAQPAAAAGELFFSEYIEGSSYNKALEIYNGTGSPVDLEAGNYAIQLYTNGKTDPTTFALEGVVAADDVFVFAQRRTKEDEVDDRIDAVADQQTGASLWNGNDAIALTHDGTTVDVIGKIGEDPAGGEWGEGLTSTAENTLRRKSTITAGDPDGSDAFDPAVEWEGFPQDTFGGLGSHQAGPAPDVAPTVASTEPTDGAREVDNGEDLSVEFSEPVDVGEDAFALECDDADVPLSVSGEDTTYTLDPADDLGSGAACTLTVHADQVTDLDGDEDAMAADYVVEFTAAETGPVCERGYTPIPQIQGDGQDAAITGMVSTKGVVVGDYEGEGSLRGFYLQDAEGDGNPETSDGIFVFDYGRDQVDLGDRVWVRGDASDFQGQTQINAFEEDIALCGEGASVEPTAVELPFGSEDEPERYEGMLVELTQTLSVTETYQLGRFGQVLLSSEGRLPQPTNIAEPGAAANAIQAANDLNQILIDDSSQAQNEDPAFAVNEGGLSAGNTLRGGDTATGTVGVMTYTWGGNSASPNAFRVRPLDALGGGIDFEPANPRPERPEAVGGTIQAASFNVLNYFNTFGDDCTGGVAGEPMECRGADNQFELDRQADKIVAALKGLDADVVGLIEIENDGYGEDSAIADLVRRLNAEVGTGTYRYLDVDTRTEQVDALGSDAIKVGMIYKHREVVPNGQTAVLNTDTFVNGDSGDPKNRPALAQTFRDRSTGGRFTLVVNHLKSKGSNCVADDDPDTGDGQGNCNQTRVDAAEELVDWLAGFPTGIKDPDVLVMGDLNSYAMEDPVDAIKDGGYVDLHADEDEAYSYVFDGQWGYLDHALASESLAPQVTGTTTWHINADEPPVLDYNEDFKSPEQVDYLYAPTPYRSSDHDPVLVGLDLGAKHPGKGDGHGRGHGKHARH